LAGKAANYFEKTAREASDRLSAEKTTVADRECLVEPGPSLRPVIPGGVRGDFKQVAVGFGGQADETPWSYQFLLDRVLRGDFVKRVIDRQTLIVGAGEARSNCWISNLTWPPPWRRAWLRWARSMRMRGIASAATSKTARARQTSGFDAHQPHAVSCSSAVGCTVFAAAAFVRHLRGGQAAKLLARRWQQQHRSVLPETLVQPSVRQHLLRIDDGEP
jgi:hypothetical protein